MVHQQQHSRAGGLTPGPFSVAVLGVYALSLGSQLFVPPTLIGVVGFAVYALIQVALIAAWLVLHMRRLRDAGRPTGWAIGFAAIYAIEVVLVLIAMGSLVGHPGRSEGVGPDASILQVFLIVSMLSGDASLAALQTWLLGFALCLLLPVVIAIGFSVWAATRPALAKPP